MGVNGGDYTTAVKHGKIAVLTCSIAVMSGRWGSAVVYWFPSCGVGNPRMPLGRQAVTGNGGEKKPGYCFSPRSAVTG